jgi:hypothetical protein
MAGSSQTTTVRLTEGGCTYLFRGSGRCPSAGLVPAVHAFLSFGAAGGQDVGAHGSSPWAAGPRTESGHGDHRLSAAGDIMGQL